MHWRHVGLKITAFGSRQLPPMFLLGVSIGSDQIIVYQNECLIYLQHQTPLSKRDKLPASRHSGASITDMHGHAQTCVGMCALKTSQIPGLINERISRKVILITSTNYSAAAVGDINTCLPVVRSFEPCNEHNYSAISNNMKLSHFTLQPAQSHPLCTKCLFIWLIDQSLQRPCKQKHDWPASRWLAVRCSTGSVALPIVGDSWVASSFSGQNRTEKWSTLKPQINGQRSIIQQYDI